MSVHRLLRLAEASPLLLEDCYNRQSTPSNGGSEWIDDHGTARSAVAGLVGFWSLSTILPAPYTVSRTFGDNYGIL